MKVAITARGYGIGQELLQAAGFEVIDSSGFGLAAGAPPEAVAAAIGDADCVIAGVEPLDASVLSACPNLKMISRRGIGYDNVDVDYCRAHGIAVARTAGMVEGAVAEHVLAYILYFGRNLVSENADMHAGVWKRTTSFGVRGRTLGLVGFGGIGKEIALRARPFGMKILYYCRHPRPEWEAEYGAEYAPLDELLARSDYLSVNVPLTAETRGMFGSGQFAAMKSGSVFINIARGAVADPLALADALKSGHLRGAAVDVFDQEPCTDSPLRDCETALLTPHTASSTEENWKGMNRCAAENVIAFASGDLTGPCRLL